MTAPDPQAVHGWTVQNHTSTPSESGQVFTTVAHSTVDETAKPSAGRSKTDQNPA